MHMDCNMNIMSADPIHSFMGIAQRHTTEANIITKHSSAHAKLNKCASFNVTKYSTH